jgi:hypothetical protein
VGDLEQHNRLFTAVMIAGQATTSDGGASLLPAGV